MADPRTDVAAAAERLVDACRGAACIRFDPDPPIDPLAAGIAAIARIYESASTGRRNRRKPCLTASAPPRAAS